MGTVRCRGTFSIRDDPIHRLVDWIGERLIPASVDQVMVRTIHPFAGSEYIDHIFERLRSRCSSATLSRERQPESWRVALIRVSFAIGNRILLGAATDASPRHKHRVCALITH